MAPPELVWRLVSDIDGWPSWNHQVQSATLLGPLAPGVSFRWKAGPGVITSTIFAIEPGHLIAWRGKSMGIEAIHVWHVTPGAEGGSLVRSEESWDGSFIKLLKPLAQRYLESSLDRSLSDLKSAAEQFVIS